MNHIILSYIYCIIIKPFFFCICVSFLRIASPITCPIFPAPDSKSYITESSYWPFQVLLLTPTPAWKVPSVPISNSLPPPCPWHPFPFSFILYPSSFPFLPSPSSSASPYPSPTQMNPYLPLCFVIFFL